MILNMIAVASQNEEISFQDPLPQNELLLMARPLGQKPAGMHKTVFCVELRVYGLEVLGTPYE